ncbi:MAG: dihydroorotase [Candidatus Thermoplasmatota archaeon]|jgi:dihydroorotase|nr:dihydroorotase [Candidatus Thermoplasmatota archaeon]
MDQTFEGRVYINGNFEQCCIGVTDGRISVIRKILKGDEHYNFKGRIILPAGVDVHVHFRDPGLTHKEDFSTGTMAAAYGGVSCVFDMPNTVPQTTTIQTIDDKVVSAGKKSYVDFGVYAGLIDSNIEDVEELAKKCCGFKIYLGGTTNSLQLDSNNLKEAFDRIRSTNKPVLIHAEDDDCLTKHNFRENSLLDHMNSRPAVCEETAIINILRACGEMNTRIHICHLSSIEGLRLLKNRSKNISCGVTPHHLLFTVQDDLKPFSYYKVNPPLRTSFDREALFDGIKDGLIDTLESDHAPHTIEEKEKEFDAVPSGLPGVETMFPMFLYMVKKGFLSFQRLVSLLCEKPAELMNIPKGKIEFGRDADFIVVDLKKVCKIKSESLHSRCGWTPFEGRPAIFPDYVFVRGEKLIEENEMLGVKGFGKFVGG